MPTDPTKPLLNLAAQEARQRQTGIPRVPPRPDSYSSSRQAQTIGPKFSRLADLMDRGDDGLELRSDPTALAPERLLVFEVRGAVSSFANAIRRIPGLELIDEEALPSDGEDINPAAYLLVPDDTAIRQIMTLWKRWLNGQGMVAGFTPWRDVFATLKDVRAWGPQDRVSEPERDILSGEIQGRADDELISLEIELVFRRNGDSAEAIVSEALGSFGGRIITRSRIEDIAYHAILAEVPVRSVRQIIALDQAGISGLEPVQFIRPQSLAANLAISDVENHQPIEAPGPLGEPILAVIDGVPIQRHPWLADHVIVDDIFELEPNTPVSDRFHGTAMASLIVHGDRNNTEAPLPRKIVSVPVLGRNDQFPSNRLIVDLIYQAVLSLKEGENPSGPHVLIINISLGNTRRPFHGQLSPWARLLDRLSYRFGILFLVSAGNIGDAFRVDRYTTRTDFEDASEEDRSSAIIHAVDSLKAQRRLLSPAETVNGVTIGARNLDWVPEASRRSAASNVEPYPSLTISNPSSAMGPGFANSVKPELLFPGSREHLSVISSGAELVVKPLSNAIRAAGLKVAAPPRLGSDAGQGYSNGTSAAAALASRTAHRIHDALEAEYGEVFLRLTSVQRAAVLKALLIHPASWQEETATLIKNVVGPSDGRQHVRQKDNIRRFLGFGSYELDDAVACASDRATFWATAVIGPNQTVRVSVPVPAAMGGKAQFHSVSATLAWLSAVNSGRQSYRNIRLRLSEPAWLGNLAVNGQRHQPDQNQMNRGTVASRRWVGEGAAVVGANDNIDFEVTRMPDLGSQSEAAITFALAVTIFMPGVNEIYEQVRERVRPTLRQRT